MCQYIPGSISGNGSDAISKAAVVDDRSASDSVVEDGMILAGNSEQGQMMNRRRCHVRDDEQRKRHEDEEGPEVVNNGPDTHDG